MLAQANHRTIRRRFFSAYAIIAACAFLFRAANPSIDENFMSKVDRFYHLSVREQDILGLLAKGLSSKEIANALLISIHTVSNHRRNICQKLGLHSTRELVLFAARSFENRGTREIDTPIFRSAYGSRD